MKKHTFTLLLGWLLLMASSLMAQNNEGRFKLKEGDWFEVDLYFSFDFNLNSGALNLIKKKDGIKQEVNNNVLLKLRYLLQKQLHNGNQIYRVSTERIMVKMLMSSFNTWLGYDTYYPPYSKSELLSLKRILFEMEVNPKGKIVQFVPDKANPTITTLYLDEISPKLKNPVGINFMVDFLTPKLLETLSELIIVSPSKEKCKILDNNEIYAKQIIETKEYNIAKVILNDSITGEIYSLKINRVPSTLNVNKTSDLLGVQLTDASFPIPANTIINGMLKDQPDKEVLIRIVDYRPFSESKEYHFKTNEVGAFNCPILLTGAQHMKLEIGNKSLDTFMEPGDTLIINGVGEKQQKVHIIDGEFRAIPDDASNINRGDFYSGQAAYNTLLAIEMDEWLIPYPVYNSIQSAESFQIRMRKKIDQILTKYAGKASPTCISYFKTEAMYYLAAAKFYFFDSQKYHVGDKQETLYFSDYPSDFFSEIDTLAILLNPFQEGRDYNGFLYYCQLIKQDRLGLSVGRVQNDNFLENYYFALASLKGYPLYRQMAKLIDKELRKGSEAAKNIESYYHEFMDNCKDPLFTRPLAKLYETLSELKIGKTFPVQSFIMTDNSVFDLSKYKGKPVCIIIRKSENKWISNYKNEIEKFSPKDVEFIFISLPNAYTDKSPADSSILAMPNVRVIDVIEQDLDNKLLKKNSDKIFILDKWLRIVDDNACGPLDCSGSDSLEKAIKKAIDAKRYSKAEQSAILKTAGWSLGSILFTLLIGIWIYRVRIRRIKQQEEAKRRIKELEIKAIRSQMNPHFIFNALNSIQSLINGNQFKEANIYLSKFAVLLRGVLNNSEKGMISLSDELQAVELYCQLEQLRFDFNFDITIAKDVDSDLIEIPGMIIQPLAENAVVHGISAKGNEGKLNIQVTRQNGNVCIGVADNGIGLTSQPKDSLSQKGFGLKLVEERINILNLEGKEARLTLRNRENNSGTLATLIIPID